MPAWNDLLTELDQQTDDRAKDAWLQAHVSESLQQISRNRGGRNVLFYASAFLQKPAVPAFSLQITHEDINGFMSTIYGMDCTKGLTLLLHTPGGVTNAAESIVAYLRSKFSDIEVIVPTFSMSAGTMISLASDKIIMGRQSQLGPIDPQMPMGGRFVSARAIVDQFEQARTEILDNPRMAHVWAPILPSLGPALLIEARNALAYGEEMVADWLKQYMMQGDTKSAAAAAKFFNDAGLHKSHGRRIGRAEAREHLLKIEDLESDQVLQEAVLTVYHLITICFGKSPATKLLVSNFGRIWAKNWVPASIRNTAQQ